MAVDEEAVGQEEEVWESRQHKHNTAQADFLLHGQFSKSPQPDTYAVGSNSRIALLKTT